MSTYIAPSFQQSQYVSGIPLDLVIQVGSMKQQQYNQVKSELQNQIDLYGSQDIIKDSDRQVINQKLTNTVDNINKYSSANLADPRVANELMSMTGQLGSDGDLVSRISNNKRARQFLNEISDIKKNKPELYNSANEKVAMQGFNSWYNDSENNQFNASYTPYFDVTKASRELIDPILKNPDIRREIEYYKDAQGITRPRGEIEVKEITRDKISQALKGLPEGAIRQMQIDYEANKDSLTVQGALQGLNSQAVNTRAQIADIEEKLNSPNILEATKKAYQNQLDIRNNELASIQEITNRVVTSGDPTVYYTPSTYINDRLFSIADTNSFKQEGSLKYDDIFKMDYKFAQDKELKALDAQYDQQLESIKAAASGIGANGQIDIQDDDTDQIVNIIANGKGTLTTDQTFGLLNGVGKMNDDGSAQLQLVGRKLYFDISPTLQAAGVNLTNELQAGAYQEAQQEYKKWRSTDKGMEIREVPVGDEFGNVREVRQKMPKSFQQYLQSSDSDELKKQSKKLGLDLSDKNNMNNVQKYLDSPEAKLTELFGKGVEGLSGSANFVPFRQDNIVSDKDGDMYTKGTLRMTRGDWITRLNGVSDGEGEELWDKMIEGGYMRYTTGEAGKNESIAELVVTTKLDRDLNSYYDQRVRERFTGDKAGAEQIPLYKQNFSNKISNAKQFNQTIDTRDVTTLVGRAQANITANMSDIPLAQQSAIQTAIQASRAIAANPDISWNQRIVAYQALDKLGKANKDEILNAVGTTPSVGNVPVPTGVTLPNAKQIEMFKNIPEEYKGYIEDSADKYGIPKNILQGLIFQESAYNPNATSPAGAKGLGQHMLATANELGVDRTNPKSSIDGAARYLLQNYQTFGDWNLALAAYNAGPNRASLRAGRIPDIKETQDYVARVNAYASSL